MFQSGCGATVHQVDEFDIRKNNDRKKKSLPALSFLQQREMQKKKKKTEIGRQAKVNF